MILITGASGKTGRALLQALKQTNTAVRTFVHSPHQCKPLQVLGAQETFVGDLRQPRDLERACQGIAAIYHICPNMQPDEVAIAKRVIAAAKSTGVPRMVYHSVLHPQTQAMPHHWQKLLVEELLFTTELDYTILQPAAYMQNVLASWQTITQEGIYRIPYHPSTRLGMIDLHDVAAAAAQVLTTDGHRGATYELASDEWLTQEEVAVMLSTVVGRPVQAQPQPRAEWMQAAHQAGLGDYAVATLVKMFDYYETYGFGGNSKVISWLLGRPPLRFVDCIQRYTSLPDKLS